MKIYFPYFIFLFSFILCYFLVPKISNVVRYKQLMDHPNERSSHSEKIPSLGGIAFFMCLIVGISFIGDYDQINFSLPFIAGLSILLFTGLKDDLVELSPRAKIIAQLASVYFILSSDILNFNNANIIFLNAQLPHFVIYGVIAFLMIALINAYNLIDGIDGLAAMVGVVITGIYGLIFYFAQNHYFFLLSLISTGMLLAYLRFNLSPSKKIFMGDTGSLILGYLIAVMTIEFLSMEPEQMAQLPLAIENLPFIVIAVLFVPLLDTGRVFTLRVLDKRSPFSPDRNHIHHILIDRGLSHSKASLIIALFNLLVILIFLTIGAYFGNLWLILGLIVLVLSVLLLLFRLNNSYPNLRRKVKVRLFGNKLNSKSKDSN